MNDAILQEISDFCRQAGLGGIHLRPPRRQRRQAREPPAQRRPHHHRDARPHPRLHGEPSGQAGAVAPAGDRALADAARAAALRRAGRDRAPRARTTRSAISASSTTGRNICCSSTPAGEVGGGEPRRAGARQHPSAPAGGARVRCRRRRRLGAHARDARDARPLPAHAVLRRRQGDQPRRHPPHLAEDGGPLPRASADRAGAHQPRLRGRAVARGEVAQRRVQHGLARGAARRQHRARVRSRRSSDLEPFLAENWKARRQPEDRQSGLRAAGGAGDLSRGSQIPARPDHPEAGRHGRRTTIWSSPRSPIARAPRSSSRRSA